MELFIHVKSGSIFKEVNYLHIAPLFKKRHNSKNVIFELLPRIN